MTEHDPDDARRALLASVAHESGIGSFVWDAATDVVVWDEPLREAFGDDLPAHVVAARLFERVHPDDRATLEHVLGAADGAWDVELRAVRADGELRWLAARGQTTRDAAGARRVVGAVSDVTSARRSEARTAELLESMSVGYLAVDAEWRITYANAQAEHLLGLDRRDVLGTVLWQRFPALDGTDLEATYRRAQRTRQPVTVEGHYPAPLDAWYEVRVHPEGDGLALYFLDITARRRAEQARDLAARRLAGVAEVALGLAEADDLAELITAVAEQGLPVLGCDGGAVAVFDPDDDAVLLSYVTTSYGPGAQAGYGRLPVTARLPVCVAATTGQRVIVRDREEAAAFSPEMAEVVEVTGSQAFASVPLRIGGTVVGVLTAGWDDPQEFGEGRLALLETFASQCAQALHRLQALEAERAGARRVARLAEGLQRSLLTGLPAPDRVELCARYVPAADEAQVGGDWYDAFRVGDDTLCLVIGDVTGHDHRAAVQMAQVRNILRGVAHAVVGPPAAVLEALDRALRDLAVDTVVTTVLATLTEGPDGSPPTLRWSSAGHPPPLLLHADGRVEHLDGTPDLLLGIRASTGRHDHEDALPSGSTLVLYTDGLVERRGEHLGTGLARLRDSAAALAGLPLDELCSTLLARQSHGHEDDVALIAVRARD